MNRNAYKTRMNYEREHLPEPQIDYEQVVTNLLRVVTNPNNCEVQIRRATEQLKQYTHDARVAAFFAAPSGPIGEEPMKGEHSCGS